MGTDLRIRLVTLQPLMVGKIPDWSIVGSSIRIRLLGILSLSMPDTWIFQQFLYLRSQGNGDFVLGLSRHAPGFSDPSAQVETLPR
jgi:hypothetical protein